MSNFLGSISSQNRTSIVSANELMAREGVNLTKSMNFRDARNGSLSVFLVLPNHDGEYREDWNSDTNIYLFDGHDSTTAEASKYTDQVAIYESGRLSENGKFYKAAQDFKDGTVKEPLQIQVYEKLDPGVWFDKGIFNLIDAEQVSGVARKIFKFHLMPAEAYATGRLMSQLSVEAMIPVIAKIAVWQRDGGRCSECGSDSLLRFVPRSDYQTDIDSVRLLCVEHSGGSIKRGLLD